MPVDTILGQIAVNTLSGIIVNLPWLVILLIGFKLIAKEIRQGIKQIPLWIEAWGRIKEKERRVLWAKNIK